jgi:hypothetical protein
MEKQDIVWKIVVDPRVPEGEMHVHPRTLAALQERLVSDLNGGVSVTYRTPPPRPAQGGCAETARFAATMEAGILSHKASRKE